MRDVPSAYSLGGAGVGKEVEGRDVGGWEGMRITVLIWILVESVRLLLLPTFIS